MTVESRIALFFLPFFIFVFSTACGLAGDEDRDGYVSAAEGGEDCDDSDPAVNPGAVDLCDGIDNDCNGTADDAEEIPYDGLDNDCDGEDIDDVDGDGFVAEEAGGDDCDDDDPEVNPAWLMPDPAMRLPKPRTTDVLDGIDNNCDGRIDEGPFSVDFSQDIEPIFTQNCTANQCHHAPAPQADLVLDAGRVWVSLVRRPSTESELHLVEPLEPLTSYLWHKLNDSQESVGGYGGSMPFGLTLLPEETRDLIYLWILEGTRN